MGREMSADIDGRQFNSCHCRPSKSAHSASRHPSPYDTYLVYWQLHLCVAALTVTMTAYTGGGGNVGRQYRHVCRGLNGLNH